MANDLKEIKQRSTFSFDVSVYGINNITGYNSCWILKRSYTDVSVLQVAGTVKDASGALHFNSSTTDTSINIGAYLEEVWMYKDASRYCLFDGVVYIVPSLF